MAPLDILVVIPAPSDLPPFDAGRAWEDIARAAEPLVARGAIRLERLAAPSENALRKRLTQAPLTALHFIGTGSARATARYGTLFFEDSTGRSRGVNTNHLASLLKQHETVQLVVLHARQSGDDALGAVAAMLVEQGVPAAVSVPSWDGEGIAAFFAAFYRELLAGATGAVAMTRARDAVILRGRPASGLELYARNPAWCIAGGSIATPKPEADAPAAGPKPPVAPDVSREQAAPREMPQRRPAGEFDVFLCHNGADKPAVKIIAQQLIAAGVTPWLDEWELPPGRPWQPLLEQQIASIRSAAVFVGPAGIGPWQEQEINGLLRQFVRRSNPVIPVLLCNAPEKPALPLFLEAMTWVDFRLSDPDPLQRLIWGITGTRAANSVRGF